MGAAAGTMQGSGTGKGGATQNQWGTAAPAQTTTPNMNNQWGGSGDYYGGFQGAGNINDQAAAGIGGAMNSAFQGMNYNPFENGGSGWGGGGGGGGAGVGVDSSGLQGWNPSQIQAGSYQTGQVGDTDLSKYENQYTTGVIDQATSDMDRARMMEQMQTGNQMTQAGSFGGSRHGLAEAENNRNFYDRQGAMSSQLRNQGFQNAQQMAMQDINNQNQQHQFNIGQDFNAQNANSMMDWNKQNALNQNQQMSAQNATSAQNANTAAGASKYGTFMNAQNQAAQHRLNSANQLANMSNLGFGMGNTVNNNMMMAGGAQQQMMQQLINAQKDQWNGYTGAGAQGLDYNNAALGNSPTPQSGTSTNSNGLFDWASMIGNVYGMTQMSDRSLKKNLKRTGKKWQDTEHDEWVWEWNEIAESLNVKGATRGVIAQDVQKINPEAVSMADNGYLQVNYGAL